MKSDHVNNQREGEGEGGDIIIGKETLLQGYEEQDDLIMHDCSD